VNNIRTIHLVSV